MKKRHEYFLNLSERDGSELPSPVAGLELRPAQPSHMGALAELMIEAYRGTIDYDGKNLDDAVREVEAYLSGKRGGRPMLSESQLAFAGAQVVGACLVAEWQERQLPLIAYIMTHATWKNMGLGKQMLSAVLQEFGEQRYRQVRAVITEGNIPSERLFGGMGFRKVDNS